MKGLEKMAKLYIVGTPIGNLKDITIRALDTLKMVDYIACEDTRTSSVLLNAYDIKKPLIAYHKFNEVSCSEKVISLIQEGNNVALITDAGMPCVSDPGAELISKCRECGVDVESVPGPTAFATAFALAGIKDTKFTFVGFMPDKKTDEVAILRKYANLDMPLIFYVAPHDLAQTAQIMYEVLGDRKAYVVREITKIYESVTITSLADFKSEERGEIVLIIEGKSLDDNPLLNMTIEEHLNHYLELGMDKKDAVKKVAQDRGITKNDVYQVAINIK